MKITAVCMKKGGVGKTTTAVTLAAGLARRGYRTLIVDLDAQAHAGAALGIRPTDQIWAALVDGQIAPQPTGLLGLDILTSGQRTTWANTLAQTQHHVSALQEAILGAGPYDHVIIDTPPTPSWLVDAALFAAQAIVAPVQLTALAGLSGQEFAAYVAAFRSTHQLPAVEIVFVPTFRDDLTRISQATLLDLKNAKNGAVSTAIHRAAVVEKTTQTQTTIWDYRAQGHDAKQLSRARQEYTDLIDRIDA